MRRAGRRVRLALVGADGWGDVRVGSTEGVVAFGRVDDTELRDLYAHAEALVLPSLWEGFGLPVAEALATGCRVACSNIPALRELAGEDATYFDPVDAPRRSPRASCTRSRSRGRRRAAARAGTTPRPRSSHSGASSCRERAARSSWSTPTPSAAAARATRATRQPAARAAGGARRSSRSRARCAIPPTLPGRCAAVGAPPARSTSRTPTGASPSRSRRSRGARTRRSPTRTTSSRRACPARRS